MAEPQIRFEDGAAYERMMGVWSRSVGEIFLDWLAPRPGLRWIDVGCGNGAFSQLLVDRCSPSEVQGIDPSDAQLAYARTRLPAVHFQKGDATALPFAADRFDAAVMALVIFFVREPAKGVAEMARVAAPGGCVAAYAWDIPGGGLPPAPIHAAMRAMGIRYPLPPSAEVSRIEALRALWTEAGLEQVATREIAVERTFADFDDYWDATRAGAGLVDVMAGLSAGDAERLKERVRESVAADAAGRVTIAARANAVQGRVPA